MKEKIIVYDRNTLFLAGIILINCLCFAWFKQAYIYVNFVFWLAIIFSPYIFRIVVPQPSKRYLIPCFALGISLFFVQMSTAYYFFFVFSLLFLIECFRGRLNYLPLFLLTIVAPLVQNFSNIWSFPIRLQLSQWAGQTLNFIGRPTEVVGNVIYMDGFPFSVDPECMGLNMLSTSLILGLLLLAFFERKYGRHFNIFTIILSLGLVVLLAILANFSRLLVLIIFRIMPDNPLHEMVGLLSLAIYVLIPFYFMIKLFSYWRWKDQRVKSLPTSVEINNSAETLTLKNIGWSIFLWLLLFTHGWQFLEKKDVDEAIFERINIANYKKTITADNILKMENETALIYVKPPIRPFQGSHDPRICWQGSGYTFENIQPQKTADTEIYTALLIQNQDTLHTAWWYSDGTYKTNSELEWRWKSLKDGNAFFLINISCNSAEDLYSTTEYFLNKQF